MSIISLWRIAMQILPVVIVNDEAETFTTAIAARFPRDDYSPELTLYIEWLRAKQIGWRINSLRLTNEHLTLMAQLVFIGYATLAGDLLSDFIS